jgi:mono/diheme cytochrome c family protein
MNRTALLVTILAACSSKATLPTIDAANAVPSSDPLYEGQYRFLYDTWGTEALHGYPPADFMLNLMTSQPDLFGNQFASFGFIPDPNDEFPIGFKRGIEDPTQVHETCAMCHTTQLPDGRLWMGAPNEHLDFGRFGVEVNKAWVAAGNPSMKTDLAIMKDLELGPGRAHADSDENPIAISADFPTYFTLAERTATNYLGTGRNVRTEAFLSIYTFGAGSPNPMTAVVPFPDTARVTAFLDFFGQLQPPVNSNVDAAMAAAGQIVFQNAACGGCHHPDDISMDGVVTMAPMGSAEELANVDPTYPRGTIATDPAHFDLEGNGTGTGSSGDDGYHDLLEFISNNMLSERETDGYRVNDLRGVWATAPYLHNGSVETLDDLFTPAANRQTSWMHDNFLVDTTVLGNGAQGHEFGTTLSDTDKAALIAYLNSL